MFTLAKFLVDLIGTNMEMCGDMQFVTETFDPPSLWNNIVEKK